MQRLPSAAPRHLRAQVTESFLQCSDRERDELLYYLIAHHSGRTLVFTNAISGVCPTSMLAHEQSIAQRLLVAGTSSHWAGDCSWLAALHRSWAVDASSSHALVAPQLQSGQAL